MLRRFYAGLIRRRKLWRDRLTSAPGGVSPIPLPALPGKSLRYLFAGLTTSAPGGYLPKHPAPNINTFSDCCQPAF
jgi:hypothetical protein